MKGQTTMQALIHKYRPRRLAQVLGQAQVTRSLKQFVKKPYPTPMLFHGESGTGKTSAAYALAHELGCSVDDAELGGLFEIASGEQTAETVRGWTRWSTCRCQRSSSSPRIARRSCPSAFGIGARFTASHRRRRS
jgi:DNA polymerase III delta prime subunit